MDGLGSRHRLPRDKSEHRPEWVGPVFVNSSLHQTCLKEPLRMAQGLA
jgi:hypothetical protein